MKSRPVTSSRAWAVLALLLGTGTIGGAVPYSVASPSRPAPTPSNGSAFAWIGRASLPTTIPTRFDVTTDVAFDGNNNLFAGCEVTSDTASQTFTTAKWNPNGSRQWVRTVSGTAAPDGRVSAITVDASSGDLIAAGQLVNTGTGQDLAVARWGSGGNLRWVRSINGTGFYSDHDDIAYAVTIDGAGDVIAVGQLGSEGTSGPLAGAAVVKLAGSDGHVLWQKVLRNSGSNIQSAYTVAADSQNHLVVAGSISDPENNSSFRVVKLDGATGEELWSASLDDPDTSGGGEQVNRVVVDAADNVLACGVLIASSEAFGANAQFTVVKLAGSDGDVLWEVRPASRTGERRSTALALALASDGDAIVSGTYFDSGGDPDSLVLRLEGGTGAEVWAQSDPDGATAVDLAVGEGDTVVTAGTGRDDGGYPPLLTVRRFDSEGTLLSTHTLATADTVAEARAVAVDSQGNIGVGGSIQDDNLTESAMVALIDCTAPRGSLPNVQPRMLPSTGGTVQFSAVAEDNVAVASVTAKLTSEGTAPLSGALSPTGPGAFGGTLALAANLGAAARVYDVRFVVRDTSGNESELEGGTVTVAAPPAVLRVTPAKLSFGKAKVGQSRHKQVTLRNAGKGQLIGQIVSPVAGFTTDPTLPPSASTPPVPFTLQPGEKKKLTVYFRPGEARAFTESLTVVLIGSATTVPPISLKGTGTAPRPR